MWLEQQFTGCTAQSERCVARLPAALSAGLVDQVDAMWEDVEAGIDWETTGAAILTNAP